jgi:hypothetical protein
MSRSNRWSRQTRLGQYDAGGLPSAPHVVLDVNCVPIDAPSNDDQTDERKLAGHVGVDKDRDGWSYVSRKIRGDHLYRKKKGYAMSTRILHRLQTMSKPVNTLYWWEDRRNMTYEFSIEQYADPTTRMRVHDAPRGDRQVVVPLSEAEHVWHDHCPIIDTRRGDLDDA